MYDTKCKQYKRKKGGKAKNGQDQLKKGEKYSWCENWQDIFKKGRM